METRRLHLPTKSFCAPTHNECYRLLLYVYDPHADNVVSLLECFSSAFYCIDCIHASKTFQVALICLDYLDIQNINMKRSFEVYLLELSLFLMSLEMKCHLFCFGRRNLGICDVLLVLEQSIGG